MPKHATSVAVRSLRRRAELFGLWRNERTDPEPFYAALAADTVAALAREAPVEGARVLDLGCGPGWYLRALRDAGADVLGLEYDADEIARATVPLSGVVRADAQRLPFADSAFDGVFCSNMLEHVADTRAVLTEIARITAPGGWAYVSWTNWYSPWGGHDMTPYHLLGPTRGPRLYERRHGPPPKNRYGSGLFPVHVGPTLRLVGELPEWQLVRAEPRYWPRLRWLVSVPGVREVFTWNCVLWLSRTTAPSSSHTTSATASTTASNAGQ